MSRVLQHIAQPALQPREQQSTPGRTRFVENAAMSYLFKPRPCH